jgi:hypothetical protein
MLAGANVVVAAVGTIRMHRNRPMIRSRSGLVAVLLAAMFGASACASTERPTFGAPTTTPTAPATTSTALAPLASATVRAATRAYLAGVGLPVLAFERRTAGLITDPGGAIAVCRRYSPRLPQPKEHNRLVQLIGGVPDPVLKARLYEDVATRLLLLECGNQPIDRLNPANMEQFRTAARAKAAALAARLAQFGLSASP